MFIKSTAAITAVTLFMFSILPVYALGDSLSRQDLLKHINSRRISTSELNQSDVLDETAQYKCDDLIEKDYYSHVSTTGETFKDILNTAGYEYERAAENITINYSTASGAVTSWMNSRAHREEMLNDTYTEVGLATTTGTLNGAANVTVICAHFGHPKTIRTDRINTILKLFFAQIGNISVIP